MSRRFSVILTVVPAMALVSCFPYDPVVDGPRPNDPYAQQGPPPQGGPSPYGSPYGTPPPGPAPAPNPPSDFDPTPQPAPTPKPQYPTARPTSNPNEVISPYAPYNVIDVTGFKSGQLAKDPSNKKIFVVP